ncbi:LacI family DNA-binding transcriptional regulator [Rhodococcus sp. BP-149]|uniref:LacI family DNA-binding transcriptional regulator n=1 Tax=unclassified Rhodococcus (in: high G+C Gram-positive bacteria) TaxID=192944 RepID=UPI001C9B74D2|nr:MULTISPECIES: LacI family DNA-binding transcriptional regulator [unclassified Rhodococcus (in: high G+C Gram-positive bacteria)]MBY6687193.1 LacI family DNA-binding transcriptional regulator [Rhodococcus sp. BP-288]MBY6694384.1 LacI family DNA-binding transcriptional regulator [Rhodococcus sp. BP-188]MBY6698093.1 LacI family DNA-binding transcriptional regulator [Rhodococcus sp. BP-285]MBY6704313.1 LacI family DNA-binding transcriptional regulator [Rhodococcus sp. BP-283]MBY6712962.1 LacI f
MATMDDVARRAGVSVSTVSHVLNGTRKVNASTRERVETAITEIGYRRNVVARSLAAGRTHTVGLSISAFTNPYFGSLVHTIESMLSDAGLVMFLGDSHDDVVSERRVVDSLLDRQVDGMILAPASGSELDTIPAITSTGTPLVLIDRLLDVACDQVGPENDHSAYQLTEHLLDLGHRRIAVVRGLAGISSSVERYAGYERALTNRGIDVDPQLVLDGRSSVDVAEREVRALMTRPDRPTAIVTMNNSMTIGSMKALRGLGFSIPSDVALVCYDDFEWSDLFEPRLTASGQDVVRLGSTAVDMLLQRIDGYTGDPRHVYVPTTFHHRNSCGCATT